MSAISDVVFAVTSKGFSALRNDEFTLKLDLKTVLTLVDGICPVAQYSPFLRAFAPLEEKFELLERTGHLRRVGAVADTVVKKFETSVLQGVAVSQLHSIDAEHKESGFAPFIL